MKKPVNVNSLVLLWGALVAVSLAPASSFAAKVNCDTVFATDKTETYKIDPADMRQCIMRGYDPPIEWRKNNGQSPGIRVSGAGGSSQSAVVAPEATPRAYGANASTTKEVIQKSCEFPPRVSVSLKGISIGGSCLDYFNDILKDIHGNSISTPAPPASVPDTDLCPQESDTTGAYGVKQTLANGLSLPCGGMVPATNIRMVLNKDPTHIAVTRSGYRDIWFYQKSGTGYSLTLHTSLPNYLCREESYAESPVLVKSVDLTPAIGQTISYTASSGAISIRLQSRSSMDPGYIPPYNPEDPEKYLIIPIRSGGVPEVPVDCSLAVNYFDLPTGQQDITIDPPEGIDGSCPTFTVEPTLFKEPACPSTAALGTDGKCHDIATSAIVAATTTDVWKCPDSTAASGYVLAPTPAPSSGCPQTSHIPPPSDYKVLCPDTGNPPVDGKCPITGDMILEDPSCGTATTVCDVVTLSPDNASGQCSGKTQYGVMNRPNIYYPSNTNLPLNAVASQPFFMAGTVDKTRFFATGDTSVKIGKSAPPITLDDGATIRLKDDTIIILEPPATIEVNTGKVLATTGAQHLSSGGTEIESYGKNTNFVIPPSLLPVPLEVSLGRSFTVPSGYELPTMNSPYVRLPQEPLPEYSPPP